MDLLLDNRGGDEGGEFICHEWEMRGWSNHITLFSLMSILYCGKKKKMHDIKFVDLAISKCATQ